MWVFGQGKKTQKQTNISGVCVSKYWNLLLEFVIKLHNGGDCCGQPFRVKRV